MVVEVMRVVRVPCACRQMVKELVDALSQDRSPVGNSRLVAPSLVDPSLQRHLSHFSAITHGFGTPAMLAALNAVHACLTESVRAVDRQMTADRPPPPPPPPARPNSDSC